MTDRFIDPLSAWPPTVVFEMPDGQPAYRVSANVLTPERARMADRCVNLACLIVLVLCILGFIATVEQHEVLAGLIVWLIYGGLACKAIERRVPPLFRKRCAFVMTTEALGAWRGTGWEYYPRRIEHRLRSQPHDRAVQEQREYEIARQQANIDRKVAHPSHYFADSSHIVYELAGHRHDLVTIYGPQDAAAVLARFQYLDRQLDAVLKIGKGVPEKPGNDWHDAPGDLP